ncbi:hypothetical protein MTR67_034582 [Solanum verrucosum]|uniref:Uncharacterized protein n=1 Tax=Solanum verrucosum TaxID=315347 RepID=A0AAF0U8D0_SOLVR|nr:hypothetical protein MTR67_034582 [Solanum verrucosum]
MHDAWAMLGYALRQMKARDTQVLTWHKYVQSRSQRNMDVIQHVWVRHFSQIHVNVIARQETGNTMRAAFRHTSPYTRIVIRQLGKFE